MEDAGLIRRSVQWSRGVGGGVPGQATSGEQCAGSAAQNFQLMPPCPHDASPHPPSPQILCPASSLHCPSQTCLRRRHPFPNAT